MSHPITEGLTNQQCRRTLDKFIKAVAHNDCEPSQKRLLRDLDKAVRYAERMSREVPDDIEWPNHGPPMCIEGIQ